MSHHDEAESLVRFVQTAADAGLGVAETLAGALDVFGEDPPGEVGTALPAPPLDRAAAAIRELSDTELDIAEWYVGQEFARRAEVLKAFQPRWVTGLVEVPVTRFGPDRTRSDL